MNAAQLLHPTVNPFNVPIDSFPDHNMGVILGQRETDFVAGKISGVSYAVVNQSGDWRDYQVRGEKQWFPSFDTFNCTGFANNNSAEIQIMQQTGVEINFSDRAMSVLAECTPTGNWLYKPADVGRNIGRLLEDDYRTDENISSWKEYNQALPSGLLSKAIRFKEAYEWIGTDRNSLRYHLKQAPILIIIGIGNALHNVVLVHIDEKGYWYFDSYDPWLKISTQAPTSALKLIVNTVTNSKLVRKGNEWGFYVPCTNEPAMIDKALNLGYVLPTTDNGTKVDWPKVKPDITIE